MTVMTRLATQFVGDQMIAVQSWKACGCNVVSINTHQEIRFLFGQFPRVSFIAENPDPLPQRSTQNCLSRYPPVKNSERIIIASPLTTFCFPRQTAELLQGTGEYSEFILDQKQGKSASRENRTFHTVASLSPSTAGRYHSELGVRFWYGWDIAIMRWAIGRGLDFNYVEVDSEFSLVDKRIDLSWAFGTPRMGLNRLFNEYPEEAEQFPDPHNFGNIYAQLRGRYRRPAMAEAIVE